MKHLPFTILFFSFSTLIAQSEYNYSSNYFNSTVEYMVQNIPGVKNQTILVQSKNARNGKVYEYKKSFNDFALMTELVSIKKGEEVLAEKAEYNSNGKIINRKSYKNGKIHSEYNIVRDQEDREVMYESFKRGKLKTKSDWSYKPNQKCLDYSQLFKKDGITIKRKWTYEYYDECEKKQSILINSKGKVLKKWTYDCKKEGEELTKKKDVSQICKWEETDDAFLLKVQQTFDEKGRVRKVVSTYRSVDTALVFYKYYNSDNELTYETEFDPNTKKTMYYKSYKKGEIKYQGNYTYEGEKQTGYAWYKNGEKQYSTEYEYNDSMQLIAITSYRDENKVTHMTTISYQ